MENLSMPDSSITIKEMHEYGYKWEGMLPLNKDKALELWDSGYPIFRLYEDDTEGYVTSKMDIQTFEGIFGIEVDDYYGKSAS